VEPEGVDVDGLLVLELEGPLAAVLVLRVLPLGPYVLLEQVVVGLEREVRGGGDVVLGVSVLSTFQVSDATYVDAPELLNRVERDDLLQQLGPVVALHRESVRGPAHAGLKRTLPLGGLVNHSVHVFMRGCLTLKFSASWKTVRISLSLVVAVVSDCSLALSPEPSVGEMGIVSSGTCWLALGAVATSAIVDVWRGMVRCGGVLV
jgi:hypothetical protein